MKRLAVLFVFFLSVVIFGGCLDDIEEASLDLPDDIATPAGLSARVGDGTVELTWRREQGAAAYRLYRGADIAIELRRIAQTADTFYTDTDVTNERVYYYAVSAYTASGVEGGKSDIVEAAPALYGVMINGGSAFAGSETVTLELTAPVTTSLMKIGNDPALSDGSWETYAGARSWKLAGGDGQKTVYAQYRDGNGTESPIVNDDIMVDTYAGITSVSVSPEPHLYSPGSTIHISLFVEGGETGGTAWAQVQGMTYAIDLGDAGLGGDEDGGDGVYEADYRLPEAVRGIDLVVSGYFTDRAGNEAQPFESDDEISFTDPPDPVYLVGASDSSRAGITIKWEISLDEYFASYRIYRDTEAGIEEVPGSEFPPVRLMVRELTSQTQTSYPDQGLEEGQTYYYRVYVVNDLLEATPSNERAASTYDAIPTAVLLDSLSSIGADRLTLTWSINPDSDFEEYRIYRATSPGVTEGSLLVTSITDRELTYFDDTGLDTAGNVYYYRIYVYDISGNFSRSNEASTAD